MPQGGVAATSVDTGASRPARAGPDPTDATGDGRARARFPGLVGPALESGIAELTGETLVDLLDRAVARTPDRTAVVLRRGLTDIRWTYRELQHHALGVAAGLRSRGVEPGDRVVTHGPNDPWLVATYFGIWCLGAICVPLDLRMRADVVERIVTRTRPRLILAAVEEIAAADGALGVPLAPIGPGLASLEPLELTVAQRSVVTPDTIAEIVCTSGTTSDPKGVVLTHGQVIHSARVIAQTGMGSHPERGLSVIPLSHMYGQIVPLFLSLISGSTLIFQHSLNAAALFETAQRERITALTAVPQLIEIMAHRIESTAAREGRQRRLHLARRLTRHLPMRARRWPYRRFHRLLGGELEAISSGGAALPAAVQRAWEDMGVRVIQGYGGTECAAIAGHTRDDRRIGSVGRPLAGLELALRPDGELLVRGPSVMRGYWEDPQATAKVLDADGWFHTGDAARFEAGEVVIMGRRGDRIALPNGLKVYPEDVEAALRATPTVRHALVLEADPGRLAAVLIPEGGATGHDALDAAVRSANRTLAPHQRVRTWRRWPERDFPRTHTRKIRREPVRVWYRELAPADDGPAAVAGTTRATGPRSSDRSLASLVGRPDHDPDLRLTRLCELVAEVVAVPGQPAPTVVPSTRLEELGIDSLGRVELALRLEGAFDARVSDEQLGSVADVRALGALVEAGSGSPVPPATDGWAFGPIGSAIRKLADAAVVGPALDIITTPRVEGLEQLVAVDGPVLVCPNHVSHLDAPLVRHVLPPARRDRTVIAAAADYFFEDRLRGFALATLTGAFAFERTSPVRASLEHVVDFVSKGWTVVIFPEGTRSMDGRLGAMRPGIGLLATSISVPIVPVHISGTYELLPKGRLLPRRRRGARVLVRFGLPLRVAPGTTARLATEQIGQAIADFAERP